MTQTSTVTAKPAISELVWKRGMAAYPTSSGPSSSIVAMRFPVVSRRRCVQRMRLGRFVRERNDDFAWENDLVAHRVYGPALETAKKEPLVSSGIDVWVKRTHRFMKRFSSAAQARRRGWQSAQMVYRFYQMPFGVFLGSMALVALFVGNPLLRWYGRLW